MKSIGMKSQKVRSALFINYNKSRLINNSPRILKIYIYIIIIINIFK